MPSFRAGWTGEGGAIATIRQLGPVPLIAGAIVVAVIVIAVVALLIAPSGGALSAVVDFAPSDDTYVDEQRPDKNYGEDAVLAADTGSSEQILLRFDVEIPDDAFVDSAILNLRAVDGSDDAGSVRQVDGDWSERDATWANAPKAGELITSLESPAHDGEWETADLTAFVRGSGEFDLYIVTESEDGVDYASSEAADGTPFLRVQWSKDGNRAAATSSRTTTASPSASPSATPTPGSTPEPTPAPTEPPTPEPAAEAILVGVGDIASCDSDGDDATSALLDSIPGTVFIPGDIAYEEGTPAQFANCYDPSWGRHKGRTRPSPGNHEYLTAAASGYFDYFGAAAGDPSKGYYAYDAGSWRVYSLNSNCSQIDCEGQVNWLNADLAANPRQCVMGYWHAPVLTAGPHAHNEGGALGLWQTLWDAGADLVVTGHDHNYQRFAPLNRDANGVEGGGMRQIIAGMGGKNLTTQSRPDSTVGLEALMDGDTDPAFGVLKLTLRGGSYGWEFVPVAGKTYTDSGTQGCR